MSATDYLWLVYRVLPAAFIFDLLVFSFALWWLERWRKARR